MLFEQIAANKRRSVVLVLIFFALLSGLGAALGHLFAQSWLVGLFFALLLGVIYAASMLYQSTEVVMSLNRAREVTVDQAPDLYHIVEDMAMVAQIPMPRVFIVDDPGLNAFAAGSSPDKAAVAATSGLLARLNREELEAVMAHEVSHIRNYDSRLATLAVALASAMTLLSSMGTRMLWYGGSRRSSQDDEDYGGGEIVLLVLSLLALVLAPLAATIIRLAISRQREFLADASAVALTRNPQGLIKALEKLDQSAPMRQQPDAASSALYITSPKGQAFEGLFRTHPPIADRIARLREL